MKVLNNKVDYKTGENLVFRIDSVLTEKGCKRVDLCRTVGITTQAINNWKKQNSLPGAETAIQIAKYLGVSVEWLITGAIDLPKNEEAKPYAVFDRILELLVEETGIPDPEYNPLTKEQYHHLWDALSGIVTGNDLINWQHNRIMPTGEQIEKIAKHFHRSYEYIAYGTNDKIPGHIKTKEIPEEEYKDFCRFKEYKYTIYSYDCLYEPDKKMVSDLITRLFRLRRAVEQRDWDFEYNKRHPLEENKQKDPNISDEEYKEMYKDDDKIHI